MRKQIVVIFSCLLMFLPLATMAEKSGQQGGGKGSGDKSDSSSVFNAVGDAFSLSAPDAEKRKMEAQTAVDKLSHEIQALKQSVITLNKDVRVLEEALLFPANTQVTVFLSQDMGKFFSLQSVKIKIDGKVVSSHIYDQAERYALTHSGVQRLLLSNLSNGKHELSAVFTGRDAKGRNLKRATSVEVEKGSGAKFIEFRIADSSSKKTAEFSVKQW